MKIAIRGHASRGKEIIQIFKDLGGNNSYYHEGSCINLYYFITESGVIDFAYKENFVKNYNFYTLEEFEKEFPFKIGDKVLVKGLNGPREIEAFCYFKNNLCYLLGNGICYLPESLKPYEEMKEERNITLTLDKAKEWYKKGGELKEIALQTFTEQELNPLPRSWEEFCKQGNPVASWRYSIPTKYEALYKLEQLRDCWRQGWTPKIHSAIYAIKFSIHGLSVYQYNSREFLSFPTREKAEEFLKCFSDLIEKAGDLI